MPTAIMPTAIAEELITEEPTDSEEEAVTALEEHPVTGSVGVPQIGGYEPHVVLVTVVIAE